MPQFFLTAFCFDPCLSWVYKQNLINLTIPEGANPLDCIIAIHDASNHICIIASCAIVAAIISTADALMNGISANITQDFNIRQFTLTLKAFAHFKRSPLLFIGISSLIASYLVPQNIIDIIISSYQISVCCLLIPLLILLLSQNK